ncbi:DNA polymerase III subunit beta [Rhizobium sp. Root274]|uniref:nucleotidyltransferase family protein n=1 Tax=unclassified Rhizobium TaxID=2613769 RepID=UPI000712907A|nr:MULTISPECIES: nucleotidyltransferase family protein [unclassified Rhizobium]KQW27410.1 DNA polymerase III subunit beta [Rhizobium sp. Root1240]KRD27645.1 DNA polymerase III subunit beta [Rhizobium sp. Root274]
MKQVEAISQLKRLAPTVRAMGATGLYVFGSTVRDEATPTSDLDLFIDYDPTEKFSLIELIGIQQFLEQELSIAVDLTTRNSLHPMLRGDIERSALRVF